MPDYDIRSRALLVKLTVHRWGGSKKDRKSSEELLDQKEAQHDAGRFTKSLIPEVHRKKIIQAETWIRSKHYALALPWTDDGWRIITPETFQEYAKLMDEGRKMFSEAIAPLVGSWDSIIEGRKTSMGKLFDPADFPTSDELKAAYHIDVDFMPVPCAGDFRVGLTKNEAEAIRQQVEATTDDRIKTASRELWQRLARSLEVLIARVESPEGKIHESVLSNLKNICEVAPRLNFARDPELDRVASGILSTVASYNISLLRPAECDQAAVYRGCIGEEAKSWLEPIHKKIKELS